MDSRSSLPEVERGAGTRRRADVPLGLYLHIPFCRKRCKFCYFRVYTDKNAARRRDATSPALSREIELVSQLPVIGGRPFRFVYFGGGTPSFLSAKQLTSLVDRLRAHIPWDQAEEVTFECEPGTLQRAQARRRSSELGVTRLSLGIENFSDAILEENGRAHLSRRDLPVPGGWIQDAGFPQRQHRPDRRHGRRDLGQLAGLRPQDDRAVARQRDDLPDGAAVQHGLLARTSWATTIETPVADWPTKRAWVDYAFDELLAAGYAVSSAYTLVKDTRKVNFSYRDNLWHGTDLFATGVASFGHVSGVHFQNHRRVGDIPRRARARASCRLSRGMRPTPHQLLIREMILQLKTGRLDAGYFRQQVRRRDPRRVARRVASTSGRRHARRSTATAIELTRARPAARRRPAAGVLRAGASAGSATHERRAGLHDGQVRRPLSHRPPLCQEPHVGPAAGTACFRFGFTAYAVRLLQDVYFLDWTVDRRHAVAASGRRSAPSRARRPKASLYAPLAGRLTRFNEELLSDPSAINVDKYGAGWLFEIEAAGDGAARSPDEYLEHLEATVWEVTQRTIKGQMNE